MPAVARGQGTDTVNTVHGICLFPGTITTDTCSPDVIVNGVGIHRFGDLNEPHTHCPPVYGTDVNVASTTVFANGMGVARIGDIYSCGAQITSGSDNVFVG